MSSPADKAAGGDAALGADVAVTVAGGGGRGAVFCAVAVAAAKIQSGSNRMAPAPAARHASPLERTITSSIDAKPARL